MILRELLREGKMSVNGFKHWLTATDLEHSTDDVEDIMRDHYGNNALKYVMAGNAFMNRYPDTLTLYRGIHVEDPELWVRNHVRGVGRNLGTSWADSLHVAIDENGPHGGFGRQQNGPTNLVMVASVARESVDWYSSFAITVIDGDEPEIRLKPNAQVHLQEVRLLNFTNRDWNDKISDQHVTRIIPMDAKLRA